MLFADLLSLHLVTFFILVLLEKQLEVCTDYNIVHKYKGLVISPVHSSPLFIVCYPSNIARVMDTTKSRVYV